MKSEDIANEIINSFQFELQTEKGILIIGKESAIQCAIIHAKGIIEAHNFKAYKEWNSTRTSYWNEVLKVLEQLK